MKHIKVGKRSANYWWALATFILAMLSLLGLVASAICMALPEYNLSVEQDLLWSFAIATFGFGAASKAFASLDEDMGTFEEVQP